MICDTTYSLGCHGSCMNFDTGLLSPVTGELTIRFKFMDTWHEIKVDAVQGESIEIPSGTFNESDDVEFEIWDTSVLSFEFNGLLYTRFKLTTKPGATSCCAAIQTA